ncbi:MAG: hypothetical protein HYY86_01095 [Candidatus Harrisonbacteria bacterium]|nr:hypothetical protein [Candidatus Harrisonbacteria bacterium]
MNLKNAALSLLDIFRLNKSRKITEEPLVPLAPLIQRLGLPAMPSVKELYYHYGEMTAEQWVMAEIRNRFPKRISRRVLGKIARHYGVDLRGNGFFKAIPDRPKMLIVVPA